MDIMASIRKLEPELIALRRDFHQHPELGLEEHRTSARVTAYLEGLGLDVRHMNKTGVVGLLQGAEPGPTLMLRADMDALPVEEATGLSFRSKNKGIMHACGHDAHTAMLLTAARVLTGMRKNLSGNIKFLFQPNEENTGALVMIEEGALENPEVDACMGIHVWSPLEAGTIGVASGPVMAGMEHFDIEIKGRGGHTAMPQSAVDPVLAAAGVIQGVQMIQTREIDALTEPTVIVFGKIQGGNAPNVIPDAVTLSGTMRFMYAGDPAGEDHPKNKFRRIVSHICAAHRTEYSLVFKNGHPSLVNDPDMAELVRRVAGHDLQTSPAVVSVVTLAGEDFSEFAGRVPGVFYFLGAGNRRKNTQFPHHHPRFDIDEDILKIGVELHVKSALRYLKNSIES